MPRIVHLNDIENVNNKTDVINKDSTNEQYPSAKAVFDTLSNLSVGGGAPLEGSITADMLSTDAVITDKIKNDAVTPEKLSVSYWERRRYHGTITSVEDLFEKVGCTNKEGSLAQVNVDISDSNSTVIKGFGIAFGIEFNSGTTTIYFINASNGTMWKIEGRKNSQGDFVYDDFIQNKLPVDFVVTDSIENGAITGDKIEPGAVDTDQIADGAVTGEKIASGAVTAYKIGQYAVKDTAIHPSAVTTDKIAPGAVTEDKIDNKAVSKNKLASNSVTADAIAKDEVNTVHLHTGAVTEDKIATNAVTEDKIKDYAVTEDKIKNGAVTDYKIDIDSSLLFSVAHHIASYSDLDSYINTIGDRRKYIVELLFQDYFEDYGLVGPDSYMTFLSKKNAIRLLLISTTTGDIFTYEKGSNKLVKANEPSFIDLGTISTSRDFISKGLVRDKTYSFLKPADMDFPAGNYLGKVGTAADILEVTPIIYKGKSYNINLTDGTVEEVSMSQ